MNWLPFTCVFALFAATAAPAAAADPPLDPKVKRIVFLGDSITYNGLYVEYIEFFLRTRFPKRHLEILNLGLPSETVSGLSEPGHAGGKFPRPDLHERLDRVLTATKPDLVIACYGMNDGIFYPFIDERFQKFQDGVRRLHDKVLAAGAQIIHLTPPVFDPLPIKDRTLPAGRDEYRQPYEGYNEVLDRYSTWLQSQTAHGWVVLDLHGPLNRHLADQRKQDPAYHLANDGVHPNTTGHWLMAQPLLMYFGAPASLADAADAKALLASAPQGAELFALIQQRQRLLKDAWLTRIGYKRPGMNPGLPLPEAQQRAAEIETRIQNPNSKAHD